VPRQEVGGMTTTKRKMRGSFCEKTLRSEGLVRQAELRYKKSGYAWLLLDARGLLEAAHPAVRRRHSAHKLLSPAKKRCSAGSKRIRKG